MIRYLPYFKSLILLFTIFGFGFFQIQNIDGQSLNSEIKFELIKKKKVRQFLQEHQISNFQDFSSLQPSFIGKTSMDNFHFHEKKYTVRENLLNVWEYYIKSNPVETWDGRKIDFGLLVSKNTNLILYETEGTFTSIDTGQVYFLNLKLLVGLYNLPVAFEIINVDDTKKVIEFSYIEGNVSRGKQVLQFIRIDASTTQIIHRSYFSSGSKLRDGVYPYYHCKIINGFHRNMKRIIRSQHPN
jgi:hypothetical protein